METADEVVERARCAAKIKVGALSEEGCYELAQSGVMLGSWVVLAQHCWVCHPFESPSISGRPVPPW